MVSVPCPRTPAAKLYGDKRFARGVDQGGLVLLRVGSLRAFCRAEAGGVRRPTPEQICQARRAGGAAHESADADKCRRKDFGSRSNVLRAAGCLLVPDGRFSSGLMDTFSEPVAE